MRPVPSLLPCHMRAPFHVCYPVTASLCPAVPSLLPCHRQPRGRTIKLPCHRHAPRSKSATLSPPAFARNQGHRGRHLLETPSIGTETIRELTFAAMMSGVHPSSLCAFGSSPSSKAARILASSPSLAAFSMRLGEGWNSQVVTRSNEMVKISRENRGARGEE